MKRGLSLIDLAKKIEANREMKADYLVDSQTLTMEIQEDKTPVITVPQVGPFPILPPAHDQIGAKVGIPGRYYDRMLTEAPELLATNVNRWFSDDQDRRMVRTLGGDMRAFLSDRYNRVENEEIAEAVLPALFETPGIEVVGSEVTDRRMYLLATTPRIQGEVRKGDVVQAGIMISNSETGHGMVAIRPMVYRLVCLNGLVVPDAALKSRHVGRRIEEGEDLNAIFSDEARKADDRALMLKVRDVVRHSLNEAGFQKHVAKFAALADGKIEGDPVKAVEVLAKKVKTTDDERAGILRSLINGADLSAFGLVNAVTEQAHSAVSFDRAVEFETAGGQLLNLPRSEWREILQAA